MAKDITKVLIKIEDETSWNSIIESSEERLVIVDIHQDWCGYCEAIHPTLARLFVVSNCLGIKKRWLWTGYS